MTSSDPTQETTAVDEVLEEAEAALEDSAGVQRALLERRFPDKAHIALILTALLVAAVAFGIGRMTSGGGEPEASHDHEASGKATVWTCSMHPQIQSPEPGDCPICGMDLIPLEEGGGDALTPDQIRLTENAKALASIQTQFVGPADRAQHAELRLLGRLDHDETRMRTVTAWTSGRIDRLKVASTGATVSRNQPIATLYSPEIYAAQQDLIQARKLLERLEDGLPVARSSAEATRRAAQQRLRLLGVSDGEIRRMERAKTAWRHVQIRSPFAGTVLEKLVAEGQYVSAGTGIYRLVDLSSLWVQLDAYERDLPLLQVGQSVSLSFEAFAGEVFKGRVAFIDPVVGARTRTTRVRVEVANEDRRLRPGMFAEAVVDGSGAEADLPSLTIPASAPLFSGRRSLVYVEVPGASEPTYEAREVRLGPRLGDSYPVVAGLEYGERVVTHGAFRLDSDLQIRGGNSLMARPDDTSPAAFDRVIELSDADRAQLAPVIGAYLDAQEALAADDLDKARGSVKRLLEATPGVLFKEASAEAPLRFMKDELAVHSRYFVRASGIAPARAAFEKLTFQISRMLEVFGNPLDQPIRLAYCPMAFNNRGAEWFQRGEEIRNAYFGTEMLQCGEIRDAFGSGAFKAAEPKAEAASAPDSAPASHPASQPGGGQ